MLRTVPWCLARISSTRCSAERMFSVPESAWLISSSVERRRDSRPPCPDRALTILTGARANHVVVRDGDGLEERHQRAQLRADLFDSARTLRPARLVEPLAPGGVLFDPLAGVLSALDLLQHLLHLGAHARIVRGILPVMG